MKQLLVLVGTQELACQRAKREFAVCAVALKKAAVVAAAAAAAAASAAGK